jgi:hypothetical protein
MVRSELSVTDAVVSRCGRALDGLQVIISPTALPHVDEILRGGSTVLADYVQICWEESSKQASVVLLL